MHSLSTRPFGGALLAAVLSTGLVAQGQFLNLPSAGTGFAVSDDGSVVTGYGFTGMFRWTAVGGTQSLNLATATTADISADGSIIMASMPGSILPSGLQEGAYWTQAAGWTSIGGLFGNNCSGTATSAYAMSDDGTVIVGLGWQGCFGRAFKWDLATGIVQLPMLGIGSTRANAVSGDGAVIGGWDEADNGQRRAAVWFPSGLSYSEVLIIPPSASNPDSAGEVWDLNSDATVIVGEETGGQAWRWTLAGGFESLGGFPGSVGGDTGTAYGTNADGSMIVGVSGSFFTGYGPFMWTEEDGMQKLETFIEDQGIVIPAGPDMTWALDITPSGYHIVGRRGDFRNVPIGEVAFWVELPAGVRYGLRRGGTNTMRLVGNGSTALGGTMTVRTDRLPGANPVTSTVIGLGSANTPLFGGTLLVDLAQPNVVVTLPVNAGSSIFNLPIPQVPAIIGASFYMQSLVIDPSVTGGMAFSNGIKSTVTG